MCARTDDPTQHDSEGEDVDQPIDHPFVNVRGRDPREDTPGDVCMVCPGERSAHPDYAFEGYDVKDPYASMQYAYDMCVACGFTGWNIPTSAEDAHDELCCGTSPCGDPGECVAVHRA